MVKHFAEKISRLLQAICVMLLIALFFLLLIQVLARFAKIPFMSWTDEIIQLFLGWFTFIGGAFLVYKKEHICISILTENTSGLTKKIIEIFITFLIMVAGAFLVYGGSGLVTQMMGKMSPVLTLPQPIWYLSAPVSGFLIIFFSIANLTQLIKGSN